MNRKWLIANIFFISFINGFLCFSAAGILASIFFEYGLKMWNMGILISLFGAGRFSVLFLSRVKAERHSITLALLLMALSCTALANFHNYFIVCAVYFAIGASAYFVNAANNFLIERICVGRADMLDLLHVFFSFGALVSSAFYIFFVYNSMDRSIFLFFNIILSVIAAAICFFGRIINVPVSVLPHSRKKKKENLDMSFFSGIIFIFLFSGCEICAVFWFLMYFIKSGTMSLTNAAAIISFMCFSVIMGKIVIGYLSDKKMQKEFVALVCAVMAVIFCFMIFSETDSRKIGFDASLFAFFMTGIYPLLSSVSTEISEGDKRYKNIPLLSAGLGKAMLPFIIGVCVNVYGARAFFPVMEIVLILCTAAIIAVISKVIFAKKQKRTSKKP